MGALHEGHASLIRTARSEMERVVISIFVNPLQFGPNEDFEKYPRTLEQDADIAAEAGADVVFAPNPQDMYPRQNMTKVLVPELADKWEGADRPGHFEGVATVVAKLFNMVQPDVAYFGRKDFQQCCVVRRMVQDLDMPLEISIQTTVREADGLAMSSRNRYLSTDERRIAPLIHQTLQEVKSRLTRNEEVEIALHDGRRILEAAGFDVSYLAYVSDADLLPLTKTIEDSTLICAVKLGNTRLIDNVAVL